MIELIPKTTAVATATAMQNSDDLRHQIMNQYNGFANEIRAFAEYSARVAALSLEYHKAKLTESFPAAPMHELTLALTLDTRETPKSLDTKLAQFAAAGVTARLMIHDQANHSIHIFV